PAGHLRDSLRAGDALPRPGWLARLVAAGHGQHDQADQCQDAEHLEDRLDLGSEESHDDHPLRSGVNSISPATPGVVRTARPAGESVRGLERSRGKTLSSLSNFFPAL